MKILSKSTKLTVHKQIYDQAKQKTNSVIIHARKMYTKNKLFEVKNNSAELFRIIKSMTEPNYHSNKLPSSSSTEDLAYTFCTFSRIRLTISILTLTVM